MLCKYIPFCLQKKSEYCLKYGVFDFSPIKKATPKEWLSINEKKEVILCI